MRNAAIKRVQNDACINYVEREQYRVRFLNRAQRYEKVSKIPNKNKKKSFLPVFSSVSTFDRQVKVTKSYIFVPDNGNTGDIS